MTNPIASIESNGFTYRIIEENDRFYIGDVLQDGQRVWTSYVFKEDLPSVDPTAAAVRLRIDHHASPDAFLA